MFGLSLSLPSVALQRRGTSPPPGSGGVIGWGEVTDAGDTATSAGGVRVSGAGAVVEANDIGSGAGTVVSVGGITGSGAVAEASDTTASAGTVAVAGTGAATDASDTASGAGTVASAGYDSDAQAAFTAMTVQPNSTRKGHFDTLVTSLKTAGVWSKLAGLYVMPAHDAQAGRINLKAPSIVATTANSPTFTTDRGYTGDGSTSYLNLGMALDAASPYAQNDCHFGVWVGTDVTGSSANDAGTAQSGINTKSSSTAVIVRGQRTTASTVVFTDLGASATSVGHLIWTRPSSSTMNVAKNGGTFFAIANASSALAAGNVLAGARSNDTAGTPAGFSSRRVQAVHFGSSLTQTENTALYNALATFMTAVGA